jgi:hypothetical protein
MERHGNDHVHGRQVVPIDVRKQITQWRCQAPLAAELECEDGLARGAFIGRGDTDAAEARWKGT